MMQRRQLFAFSFCEKYAAAGLGGNVRRLVRVEICGGWSEWKYAAAGSSCFWHRGMVEFLKIDVEDRTVFGGAHGVPLWVGDSRECAGVRKEQEMDYREVHRLRKRWRD